MAPKRSAPEGGPARAPRHGAGLGGRGLRSPERQAKLAAHQAVLRRERSPERVEELRRRLGRDPLEEEVIAFLSREA